MDEIPDGNGSAAAYPSAHPGTGTAPPEPPSGRGAPVFRTEAWLATEGNDALIYLLQATQQHHVQISVMADVKASILITATSLILTAAVTITDGDLRPGLVALMLGSAAALVGALLAVLPAANRPESVPRPGSAAFNLLFFGHFTQLPADEFVDRVLALSDDPRHVFATQARDIHELGSFLQRAKFRHLRFGYLAFLTGIASGLVAELGTALLR